jgi:glycosyltransferase involved in cell wall biosynthesis
MIVEALISCMYQKDMSIAKKSNINFNCLIINQCDQNGYNEDGNTRMISVTERGLSKSRNLAIKNAIGDICLICDDDGVLHNNAEELLLQAYNELPDADIVIIKMHSQGENKLKNRIERIGYKKAMSVPSRNISFKRKSVLSTGIKFDETVGSGISSAGGEEVLFLFDCLKRKLKIYFYPVFIGQLTPNTPSQWFKGYTKEYWFDRGIFTRKLFGLFWGALYIMYFLITKYKIYKKDTSVFVSVKNITKGLFKK